MRCYVVHFTDGAKSHIIEALNEEVAKREALAAYPGKVVSHVETL